MNKIIVTDPHLVMSIVGPSGCGKTKLLCEILKNRDNIFRPDFDSIIFFYLHWQPIYEEILLSDPNILFKNTVNWEEINASTGKKRTLLIFDDMYVSVCQTDEFLNLIISGRRKNLHVIWLKHNLYQKNNNAKTIDVNTTHMLLLQNPRDLMQIDCLGRQLGCRNLLLSAYKRATQDPFGHLLIDLDPRCHKYLRFASEITSSFATFHLPSSVGNVIDVEESFTESEYFKCAYRL